MAALTVICEVSWTLSEKDAPRTETDLALGSCYEVCYWILLFLLHIASFVFCPLLSSFGLRMGPLVSIVGLWQWLRRRSVVS